MAATPALQLSLVLIMYLFSLESEIVLARSVGNSHVLINVRHESGNGMEKAEHVVQMLERSLNGSKVGSCGAGNPIGDCRRCDSQWAKNRKRLAECAIGFRKNAIGGKNGKIYTVTDPHNDDPVNPRPGTLRHAVIQTEPLWIIFKQDMVIQLKQELIMNSYKTIDGRGAKVHIANGACITIQNVNNIIIHGIHIHNCRPTGNANVRSSPTHNGFRGMADGDGINIFESRSIWVDHCSLSSCADWLIDAVMGSTAITISNNFFSQHDKAILLGHSDEYTQDVKMQVTVAFNHFGEGLGQRMPRCRHGYFHVVNNDYTKWGMYAIGGSAKATIYSQGNRFLASDSCKEVTHRGDSTGNWKSEGDMMLNGAFFKESGATGMSNYAKASSIEARPSSSVPSITANAGVLTLELPNHHHHITQLKLLF